MINCLVLIKAQQNTFKEEVKGILCSEVHKLFNSILNKEKLLKQWKGSIVIPIYKKGAKTECSNY
jgi:hypothetical protein